MQGPGSDRENLDGILKDLFSSDLEPISHRNHPGDDVLIDYLKGRLNKGWSEAESLLQQIRSENAGDVWQRNEVTAHLLTCVRCQNQIAILRETTEEAGKETNTSLMERLWAGFESLLSPIPRPAVATMAIQSVIIVGLGALLLSQPAFLENNTALISSGTPQQSEAESAAVGAVGAVDDETDTLYRPSPAVQPYLEHEIYSRDTDTRISAAKNMSASNLTNLSLLADAITREEDSRALNAFEEEFIEQLTAIEAGLSDAFDKISLLRDNYTGAGDFPLASSTEDFRKQMNSLFHSLSELDIHLGKTRVSCRIASGITINELFVLLSQAQAALIVDPLDTAENFIIHLPAINHDIAIDYLESSLAFDCAR